MPDAVLELLRRNLAAAEADVLRLQEAIATITSPVPAKPGNRTETPGNRDAVTPRRILRAVGDAPGTTTSTLAKRLDGDQDQILASLKQMETDGKVKRTGERRGTRWHLAA
jgi:predicted Rossmann fold nucleotide-binding protein DprA/Smf involved in DNA uptake